MVTYEFEKFGFKTVNGRALYYPHGGFGSGYFVDEATRTRIESFLRNYYGLGLQDIHGLGDYLSVGRHCPK